MEKACLSPSRRHCLLDIFNAGLRAVAPDAALKKYVRLERGAQGRVLHVAEKSFPLDTAQGHSRRLIVLGAGKGAAPMAQALESLLGEDIHEGHVIVKYDHALPLTRIRLSEAAHPVPDAAGEQAARQLLDLAHSAQAGDIVLCLFTGGASALTPVPCPGISLADMQATTTLLLGCGATIHELNAVRKHLSNFSGGQLARAAQPATVISLIVSDVIGDDLDVIASGPSAPDASTYAECLEIIRAYALTEALPAKVLAHIRSGCLGLHPETPKVDDPLWGNVHNCLVATLPQALEAAAAKAVAWGFVPHILGHDLCGEARDCAVSLIDRARLYAQEYAQQRGQERSQERSQQAAPASRPLCLLAGGESTVTLRGTGTGGRNQEMALAASLALRDVPNICALFAGTDGTDGPTDAAGGYACGESVRLAAAQGLDAQQALADNNSYPFLARCDRLLKTGPTRTNVMDMAIILIFP